MAAANVTTSSSATTGFKYTPPSYLLRASDTTNRPWNSGSRRSNSCYGGQNNDYDHDIIVGDNEYDLPQEERPQTRRESFVDAHFHQRVRTKQNRYRDMIQNGQQQQEQQNDDDDEQQQQQQQNYEHNQKNIDDDDDDNDSLLALSRNVDSRQEAFEYTKKLSSSIRPATAIRACSDPGVNNNNGNSQSSMNVLPKISSSTKCNKPDLMEYRRASIGSTTAISCNGSSGTATTAASTKSSSTTTTHHGVWCSTTRSSASGYSSDADARSLRSQRLRNNLLKVTTEEYDLQTKLELRRSLARKQEAAASAAAASSAVGVTATSSALSMVSALTDHGGYDDDAERQARAAIEKERRKLKQEREALARTKREAAIALQKIADEAEKKKKKDQQRLQTMASDRRKKIAKARRGYYNVSSSNLSDGSENPSLKKKNKRRGDDNNNNDNTDSDDGTLVDFVHDLTGLVRDNSPGFMQSCFCLPANSDDACGGLLDDESTKKKKNASSSSPPPPHIIPCSEEDDDISIDGNDGFNKSSLDSDDLSKDLSLRRSRLYAKYRE